MKTLDTEKMGEYCLDDANDAISTDSLEEAPDSITESLFDLIEDNASKLSYELISSENDGKQGTVIIKFTYLDAKPAISEAVTEYISQAFTLSLAGASQDTLDDLLESLLENKLKNYQYTTTSKEVTFNCVKDGSSWKIKEIPDELESVVFCDINDAFQDMADSFSASFTDTANQQADIQTKNVNYVEGNGYKIEIAGADLVTTESGELMAILTFNYTNNNAEPKSFSDIASFTVYQNGVECNTELFALLDGYDLNSKFTNVKNGATIQVNSSRRLSSNPDTLEVELTLYESGIFSNPIDKTLYNITPVVIGSAKSSIGEITDSTQTTSDNDANTISTLPATADNLPTPKPTQTPEKPVISIYSYSCDITKEKSWPSFSYSRDGDYVFSLSAVINDESYSNLPIAWTTDTPDCITLMPDDSNPTSIKGVPAGGTGQAHVTATCGDASTTITIYMIE